MAYGPWRFGSTLESNLASCWKLRIIVRHTLHIMRITPKGAAKKKEKNSDSVNKDIGVYAHSPKSYTSPLGMKEK